MEDKHQRVTQPQYDLWIDNPVTQAYLQCLKWSAEQQEEIIGNGSLIDNSNNDLSMNRIQYADGASFGFKSSSNPISHFKLHEMIEVEDVAA